ncbi:hypothetical protein U27_02203 [Candidatus Vecturithrix granuli]|uniref:DUF370 domain-containing protein n=1 Tax=Vecturithrix granuli TaxID=1499967 RepID=A0A0S6WAP8_VECG1|nr:hypothetical protein U27_02203 [Candidatus Vecturithrix granuli]
MYLHIGMNVYLLSERIIGIFEASQFQSMISPEFLQHVTRVDHEHEANAVKSYVLTTSQEIHCSNVHCRTLKKRWRTDA